MALTSDQESKIQQIIEAFDNGKRLNELPEIGDTNPLDLIVEVLDTDGESKQARLAGLLPYLEEECAYGVEWSTASSATARTRIGNVSLHKSLPIQSRMRGCLLDDNGNVVEYLSPSDWSGHTLDGSKGQVMVEIPQHYRMFETSGTTRRCKISEYPLPGYHVVPKMYISAYEASVQRSTTKLCSVMNTTADYRGGDNTSGWDGTYRSLLGMPATGISRTNFRAYARKRNTANTKWNCLDYNAYKAVFWLYVVEYANSNCQLAYNAALTSEGYRQGGLGNGVTTLNATTWNTFNGYNPFIPCGYTNSLGNRTGTVAFDMPSEYGSLTVDVPRYRGIENPFGHIWKWTDGINIKLSPDAASGGDGTSKVFAADDPSDYSDSGYDNYSQRGLEARNQGYVKTLVFGELGDIMPAEVGGGSTTYWADNHYTVIPTTESLRGVLFGGAADNGAHAGFAFALSSYAPSYAGFGSRLCYIP